MISSDFTEITVDDNLCRSDLSQRYRFTLAHEIGHWALHGDLYSRFNFSTIDEYQNTMQWIQENVIGGTSLEWQASEFAGLILVPTSRLETEFANVLGEAKKAASDAGYNDIFLRDYVCMALAQKFEVAFLTAKIRVEREKLLPSP